MSSSTKRKHVTSEVLNEWDPPDTEKGQRIVKILGGRGNNLHEVLDPTSGDSEEGEKYLTSMPTKFRKNVWVKRGDFVIVEPILEGDKVKAEIVRVLYKDQIRHLKKEGHWPRQFDETSSAETGEIEKSVGELDLEEKGENSEEGSSSSEDDDLFVNTNRPVIEVTDDEDETSSSEGEEEDK